MLNSNFLKMFKERLNLRKVATIVACLVVTTMFASCDSKNGDDDGNDGKIDTKLVGVWRLRVSASQTMAYSFKKDGTFMFTDTGYGFELEGKYTVSGSKISCKDMNWYSVSAEGRDEPTKRVDVVLEFKYGKDNDGKDCIIIYALSRNYEDTYIGLEGADTFSKYE